jgi:hypothetical protein
MLSKTTFLDLDFTMFTTIIPNGYFQMVKEYSTKMGYNLKYY